MRNSLLHSALHLDSLVSKVVQVDREENADFLFPQIDGDIERFDLTKQHEVYFKGVMNHTIYDRLQLVGHECIENAGAVGYNTSLYSRLAPLFLAHVLEQRLAREPWLDYKAFSMNCRDDEGDCFGKHIFKGDHACRTEHIQHCVEMWMRLAMSDLEEAPRPGCTIFRRCLVINFATSMCLIQDDHFVGHVITLAIEKDLENADYPVKLMVFDYRMHEYDFNVHDRLFQWMADCVAEQYMTVNLTICLKKRFQPYTEFMMCMSVAYRVCVFLSFLKKPELIRETVADFDNSSRYIQDRTNRMCNWLHSNSRVLEKQATVIVSQPMSESIFQIHSDACFLYMVPYSALHKDLYFKDIYELRFEQDESSRFEEIRYNPSCDPILTCKWAPKKIE